MRGIMKTSYVFLFYLFTGLLPDCQCVNYCPPNGLLHTTTTGDQICYYGYDGYSDYDQSIQNCGLAGGFLAEIPEQAAQNAVFNYIQTIGLNGWGLWIGYTTDSSNNLLREDNTVQSDYDNFIFGEPTTSTGIECVHFCNANTGEWCASPCTLTHQALCSIQYNAAPPEITTALTTEATTTEETTIEPTAHSTESLTTTSADECTLLGGFVHDIYCYWMPPNYYTFDEAEVECMLHGGSLAQMKDLHNLLIIYQAITDRGYHVESIWIGYLVFLDAFDNVDRYTLDCLLQPWSYYVPSFDVIDDCVSLHADSNGMMSSDFCMTEKRALCFNKTINPSTNCLFEIMNSDTTTSAESTMSETTASTAPTTSSTETTTTSPPQTTTTTTTSTTPTTTSTSLTTSTTPTTITTTTQSTTTSEAGQQTGTNGPTNVCVCHCDGNEKSTINVTAEDLARALSVNKSSLSSVRRSKTSADDPRPSARYLGSVGIAMLSVVFGLLIIVDAFRFCA